MNRRFLIAIPCVLVLMLAVAAGAGRIGVFKVYMSGDQEVAPINNAFIGRFGIAFDDDLAGADVNLTVFAANVIGAHLHCGRAGTNGPIIVNLLNGPLIGSPQDALGRIGRSSITNADIIPKTAEECGGMPINNIASLFAAMMADNVYVNAHTSAFPGGALRAQFFGELVE